MNKIKGNLLAVSLVSGLAASFAAAAAGTENIMCYDDRGDFFGLMVYDPQSEDARIALRETVPIREYGQDYQGLGPEAWDTARVYLTFKDGKPHIDVVDAYIGPKASKLEIAIEDAVTGIVQRRATCAIPRP